MTKLKRVEKFSKEKRGTVQKRLNRKKKKEKKKDEVKQCMEKCSSGRRRYKGLPLWFQGKRLKNKHALGEREQIVKGCR